MRKGTSLSIGLVLHPRSFVISSPTHALAISTAPNRQLQLAFVPRSAATKTGIRLAPCWGCLGIIEIESEIFILIVTHAAPIGLLHPTQQQIYRVISVDLFCLTSTMFDFQHMYNLNSAAAAAAAGTPASSSSTGSPSTMDNEDLAGYPTLHGIRKLLSNGQFFFSGTSTDLASRTEYRLKNHNDDDDDDDGQHHEAAAKKFSWNSFMRTALVQFQQSLSPDARTEFDRQNLLVSVIQGYVATYDMKLPPPPPAIAAASLSLSSSISSITPIPTDGVEQQQPMAVSISLFSRLGSGRAGTRFNTRGLDDAGNVANFVESETLVTFGGSSRGGLSLFSFVQLRGSVPLFFEQTGTGMTSVIGGLSGQGHKTQLTRTGAATQPAFERHFASLMKHYPVPIHVLNLLSKARDAEASLSLAYHQRLLALNSPHIRFVHFDLHHRAKAAPNGLDAVRQQLQIDPLIGAQVPHMAALEARLHPPDHNNDPDNDVDDVDHREAEIVTRQQGVFRVNCLDCLDRTNVVQEMLSRMALEAFLARSHPHLLRSEYLWNCHRSLWADNGDVLSKIYAGTGALNSSFTRGGKQTFSGILSNASKSVGRMYNSNFIDKSKQAHIDLMLGNLSGQKPVKVFDPLSDTIKRMLQDRRPDYSQTIPISLWVGTYNLNGRAPPMANSDELMAWLCPSPSFHPDIMAVSFQEIVKLSPQQIMITDPEKKRRWERVILASLENRPHKKASYSIIRSDQLVGAALIILAKNELVPAIRAVEAKTKKTGLKGISGNKGAVAIRLDVHDTSFCFVTAHFAAGLANYEERNHDYHVIDSELKFGKGRTISGHENVVWAGDFNYRIDAGLLNNAVRQAVVDEKYDELLAADQLLEQMAAHAVFPKYTEGPITFPPTYKYDLGTDRYDTSEKMRIPAWTDRILYQGSDLKLIDYSRAELKASDHRPVYAILETEVRLVDRLKKEAIKQEILESSEVSSLREALMMPLEAGDTSLETSTILDEWWKAAEPLDGTYDVISSEEGQITGASSNPFAAKPTTQLRSARQSSTPGVHAATHHRLVNGKFDRQISSSVPSSPPAHSVRSVPPAIPARPGSRSPSQTRNKPALAEKPAVLSTKVPPPPPPPRPPSRPTVRKENPPVEIKESKGSPPCSRVSINSSSSLKNNQHVFLPICSTEALFDTSRTRSLSGRKSAPTGLHLGGVPPPPSHPALRHSNLHRPEFIKSPLLSASTSKLLSTTPTRPDYNSSSSPTPLPPPRPASRGLKSSDVGGPELGERSRTCSPRSSTFSHQARDSTVPPLVLLDNTHHPPLPPRPISKLLLTGSSEEGFGVDSKAAISSPSSSLVNVSSSLLSHQAGEPSLSSLSSSSSSSSSLLLSAATLPLPLPPRPPASRLSVLGKECGTGASGTIASCSQSTPPTPTPTPPPLPPPLLPSRKSSKVSLRMEAVDEHLRLSTPPPPNAHGARPPTHSPLSSFPPPLAPTPHPAPNPTPPPPPTSLPPKPKIPPKPTLKPKPALK
ncbi:hypothetical protein PCANC_18042 [Puccinia coronata f. sp. avenae]|uniref:phosphoinositide 5-phosphatase n=1 Tax=Puccinia coronata f. sp. avenae TaxID=200324 RepID=A0A2N5SEY2_9BASI|nr:hypothetical protein PCASD_21055 [Puccinia coronata f. sp. avenae]PLW16010.1 hypothetical protein PCANC_18042 [Puccinia coronata f. sp. avenae]